MTMHKSITPDRIKAARERNESRVDAEAWGFCFACGEDVEGANPNAFSPTECVFCEAPAVHGLVMTIYRYIS